jgi:hypothetical protein
MMKIVGGDVVWQGFAQLWLFLHWAKEKPNLMKEKKLV